jgi:hypothetical protein
MLSSIQLVSLVRKHKVSEKLDVFSKLYVFLLFRIPDEGRRTKSRTPVILSVEHLRQNPLNPSLLRVYSLLKKSVYRAVICQRASILAFEMYCCILIQTCETLSRTLSNRIYEYLDLGLLHPVALVFQRKS